MRLGLSKGQSTMAGDVLGLGAWNCLHLRAPVYTGNKGPMVTGHLRSPRQPNAAMTIRCKTAPDQGSHRRNISSFFAAGTLPKSVVLAYDLCLGGCGLKGGCHLLQLPLTL